MHPRVFHLPSIQPSPSDTSAPPTAGRQPWHAKMYTVHQFRAVPQGLTCLLPRQATTPTNEPKREVRVTVAPRASMPACRMLHSICTAFFLAHISLSLQVVRPVPLPAAVLSFPSFVLHQHSLTFLSQAQPSRDVEVRVMCALHCMYVIVPHRRSGSLVWTECASCVCSRPLFWRHFCCTNKHDMASVHTAAIEDALRHGRPCHVVLSTLLTREEVCGPQSCTALTSVHCRDAEAGWPCVP